MNLKLYNFQEFIVSVNIFSLTYCDYNILYQNKLKNRKIKVITHDGFCCLFPPSPKILMCQAMVVSCLLLVFLLSSFLVLYTPFLHITFLSLEILSITAKVVTVAFEKCLTRSPCEYSLIFSLHISLLSTVVM